LHLDQSETSHLFGGNCRVAEYFENFLDFFFFELQKRRRFCQRQGRSTFEATLISVFSDLNTVAMAPKKSKNDAQSIGAKVRLFCCNLETEMASIFFFSVCTDCE